MINYDISEFKKFARRMLVESVILIIIGIIILLCVGRPDAILGWIWGNIGDGLYFVTLYRNLIKLPSMEESKRQAFVNKTVGKRFFGTIILVIIAAVVPQLHLLAVTAGLISFKLLIYIDQLVVKPFILPRLNKKIKL